MEAHPELGELTYHIRIRITGPYYGSVRVIVSLVRLPVRLVTEERRLLTDFRRCLCFLASIQG